MKHEHIDYIILTIYIGHICVIIFGAIVTNFQLTYSPAFVSWPFEFRTWALIPYVTIIIIIHVEDLN